jgi:hypothetical protein
MSDVAEGCAAGQLRVSLRECRLLVERVLLVAGAPRGALAAAVDAVVSTEVARSGALEILADEIEDGSLDLVPLRDAGKAGGWPLLDAGGGSALFALDAVLDLAGAGEGWGVGLLANTRDVLFAAGLGPLAARRGCVVAALGIEGERTVRLAPERGSGPAAPDFHPLLEKVSTRHGGARSCLAVAVRRDPAAAPAAGLAGLVGDPWTAAVVSRQMCVDERVWWSLFDRSTRALTPASDLSRLDTGITLESAEQGAPVDAY